jgi:hypothetical protein
MEHAGDLNKKIKKKDGTCVATTLVFRKLFAGGHLLPKYAADLWNIVISTY